MTALSWIREMFGMTAEHSAYECRERGVKIAAKARIAQFRGDPGGPAPPPVGRGSPDVRVAGNRGTVAAGAPGPPRGPRRDRSAPSPRPAQKRLPAQAEP